MRPCLGFGTPATAAQKILRAARERKVLAGAEAAKRVFATNRQPEVSRSSRWTRRGRWSSASRKLSSMPSICGHAGAALHRKPHGLVEHQHVVVFVKRNRFQERARLRIAAIVQVGLASSRSGGMRTDCPGARRSLPSTRLPSTRSSPLRMTRWICENENPENSARKRSTRMPASSAETATVCALVGSSVEARGAAASGRGAVSETWARVVSSPAGRLVHRSTGTKRVCWRRRLGLCCLMRHG